LISGRARISDVLHLPTVKSAAAPVMAVEPVKEYVGESPDGLLMKAEGVVIPPMTVEFHIHNPWPNLALKSPNMTHPFP
jgi:hypothetical protein